MNDQNRLKLLNAYIKANVTPILFENGSKEIFKDATILSSDVSKEDLNGKYVDENFVAPDWYMELSLKKDEKFNYLIIDKINEVEEEKQTKFHEILKFRKISTFELPENCVIILTTSKKEDNLIAKEIYSLVAHI